jgi:SAM-dependent methyltransferase
LRLMRSLYFGDLEVARQAPAELVCEAERAGLVRLSSSQIRLTDTGYLIGNVAKEYCNFLDNGRQMPPPKPPEELFCGKDVLDLGCSFGRWLWVFQQTARTATGIEMQPTYIELGAALSAREGHPAPRILLGSIEDVDRLVAPGSMDFVFSRLVFNHVAIRSTLAKTVTTLRPGAVLWLQVETIRFPLNSLVAGERRFRSKALAVFALANTAWCTATGHQVSLRSHGRMHSHHRTAYPLLSWWRSALEGAGLVDFEMVSHFDTHAAFCARKPA